MKQAVVALCVLLAVQARAQPAQIVGTATSPDDGSVLYEEHHMYGTVDGRRTVSYRLGSVEFASKSVDYAVDSIAPDFVQHDTRRGEVTAARRNPQGGHLELGYRERGDGPLRWTALEASVRPLVIDAGFDNFVQQQWQALAQGGAIAFDFGVPSKRQAVHLLIEAVGRARCGKPHAAHDRCFRVQAGNYLVRLFFPPLHLLYDSDRRLRRFIGLSNINDEQGEGQPVRIDYQYVFGATAPR